MTLSANINPEINWSYGATDAFGQTTLNRQVFSDGNFDLADGTGSEQANKLYIARRTITGASTADDLDFAGGVTDVFGNVLTFTFIKALLIHNRSTVAADDLRVGGSSNPITSLFNGSTTAKVRVHAGGSWLMSSPYEGFRITAGSADTLRIEHAGLSSAITYDIIAIGVG